MSILIFSKLQREKQTASALNILVGSCHSQTGFIFIMSLGLSGQGLPERSVINKNFARFRDESNFETAFNPTISIFPGRLPKCLGILKNIMSF